MKKRLITTIVLAVITLSAKAQKVTFVSDEFMAGVKTHLGLTEGNDVMQSQTDTITVIDLSGLDIVDISDVNCLPNVKWIDLSNNKIEDVSPLASLEHLEYVNLMRNALESINPLAFACTDSLHVNVAGNYIREYDYLFSVTSCHLQIEGMGAQQKEKNAPYFDVYQFYADVSNAGEAKASWRGYTNMESEVSLKCGAVSVKAQMDGYTNSVALPRELAATTQAVLSNGVVGDTTYVVPPLAHIVKGGDVVTIDTELPASYQIGYLRALHGNVEADGKVLHYKAPSNIVADTLYMSYYEAGRIRGFAQMYFMTQDFYDGIEAPMQDAPLKMTLRDGILHIAGTPEELKDVTDVKVYDATGRTLVAERQADGRGIVVRIPKSPSIVIVEVTLGERRIVTKVAAR